MPERRCTTDATAFQGRGMVIDTTNRPYDHADEG